MGIGNDRGGLAARKGDDTGDVVAGDWERRWRLSGWELETTV